MTVPRTFEKLYSDEEIRKAVGTEAVAFETFEALSKVHIIQRGYWVRCPSCDMESWYSLQAADESIVCPGCLIKFPLPIREDNRRDRVVQWSFRLNSLVNRVVDYDLLVPLLAVFHLSRKRDVFGYMFGLEVRHNKRTITDFDFVLVSEQKIVIGECKSGSRLEKKDFDNARRAAELGCEEYYFCTTSNFCDEAIEDIGKLATEFEESGARIRLAVLQRENLFDGQEASFLTINPARYKNGFIEVSVSDIGEF